MPMVTMPMTGMAPSTMMLLLDGMNMEATLQEFSKESVEALATKDLVLSESTVVGENSMLIRTINFERRESFYRVIK